MSAGHRHRVLRLRRGRLQRLLQTRLLTADRARAERSRWVWVGQVAPDTYVLTPLSILHTLTGLCLVVTE